MGVLYTWDLANTAVFFHKWLHLQEYRPSALSCVTAASKKRDANIGYHRCLLRHCKSAELTKLFRPGVY